MEENRQAELIAEHLNRLIANDPRELQQYMFATIARNLGVSIDAVRSAISNGGYNGITLRVTSEDRELLKPYVNTRA